MTTLKLCAGCLGRPAKTDITELAQSLKAAAEKATPGRWEYYPGNTSIEYNVDSMDEGQGSIVYVDSGDFTQAQTDRNGEFIALANPASILALVEALEKAQETIAFQQGEIKALLSSLESRTVTVKQGEVLVTVAGFTGCGKSAIAGEIEIAMKAIGLPVTWANGDSEKRMTGADWLTAIEMYKPTVRIVEVNIPRAAGIKVEAE